MSSVPAKKHASAPFKLPNINKTLLAQGAQICQIAYIFQVLMEGMSELTLWTFYLRLLATCERSATM